MYSENHKRNPLSIQLSKLVPEMMGRRFPHRSEQPDRRDKALMVLKYLRKNLGRGIVSKWEFSRSGTIMVYFGVIHHDPKLNNQVLPRIIATAEKFNLQFRMFGDGNQIAVEILIGI